uniref:COMM domain-containing protein n=1 Tax=Plectus sambesii TaxID=2011161 RepID=A0A914UTG9_9BILA
MTSGSIRSRPSAPPVQAGAAVWIICIYISILLESVQCRGTFHRYQFVLNAMSSQVEAFEWTKSSNLSPSEQSVAVLKLTLSSRNKNTTRSDADTVAAVRFSKEQLTSLLSSLQTVRSQLDLVARKA